MSFQRKEVVDARPVGGNTKMDGKMQNGMPDGLRILAHVYLKTDAASGNRPGFRTDASISNTRNAGGRELQRWVPDAPDNTDGGLEASSNRGNGNGQWDQFAANKALFGVDTTYNENFYTTALDKNSSNYKSRAAAAERVAREIEGSVANNEHVAEERQMDFSGGNDRGGDEEDKWVCRI